MAWHHYNVKPLKILFAFKTALLIDSETARLFWRCILEPSEEKALAMLPRVCERLMENLSHVPDARSREILGQGLEWARDHPESIQIHTDRKIARQGHFPNMVAFAGLLEGLESHSQRFNSPVARITHDKQTEFQRTLDGWHEMFSNASPEKFRWAGETYCMQRVPGSTFEVKGDEASPGLQITDIILWLYHQIRKGRSLPEGCMAILAFVFQNGQEIDFSFSGVERKYLEKWQTVRDAPLTHEQEEGARQMLAKMEQSRQQSMERYERDGLPPFKRPAVEPRFENQVQVQNSSAQPGGELDAPDLSCAPADSCQA